MPFHRDDRWEKAVSAWFTERDWKAWDHQIEQDAGSGKLDFLLDEAMAGKKNNSLGEI